MNRITAADELCANARGLRHHGLSVAKPRSEGRCNNGAFCYYKTHHWTLKM
jgi:hypothetical protein